jgi:hypothetical protein
MASASESAMIGPGFGLAIAVEGFGKRYLDPRRRWNLGLLLFWDNLWFAKRQELNPRLLYVAANAMTS